MMYEEDRGERREERGEERGEERILALESVYLSADSIDTFSIDTWDDPKP